MNYETPLGADVEQIEAEEARNRRRWWIIGGAIAAILMVLIITNRIIKSSHEDAAAQRAAAAAAAGPVVSVIVPGTSTIAGRVTATGSLAARREMPVGVVGEGGMVTRVLVEPGTWVKSGQTLAIIERSVQAEQARSLAAQVEVARADAKLAQAQLDRAQALVSRGFVSRADIDQRTANRDAAVARVDVASAQLAEARARTGRLDIRAPAAGLILTRTVEAGQVVAGGSGVLFRMAKDGELELAARVNEVDLARLRVGQSATVTPVGSPRTFAGRIWQLSPIVDPQSRQGTARVLLSYDPALRPGGFASVAVTAGTGQAPLLPEAAVQNDDQGSYVYIIDRDSRVRRQAVKVGEVSERGVAITAGLRGDERVVAMAGAFLSQGQKVRPETHKAAR